MTLILPPEKVAALEALRDNGHPLEKFSHNPQGWVDEAEKIAVGFGLHQGPPLRILDIGCGYGYFLWVCEQYRHQTFGVDVSCDLLWQATAILARRFCGLEIQPGSGWPDRMRAYDVVTTFGVNFRMENSQVYWGEMHYRWLATTIRIHLLPGGRWVLRPNQTDDQTSPIADLMDAKWWAEVLDRSKHHATITISKVEGSVEIRWPND